MTSGAAVGLVQRRLRALRAAVVEEVRDVNRMIYHVLLGGSVTSLVLLLAALAWAAVAGGFPERAIPFDELAAMVATPAGALSLGLLILILTPVARVALSLAYFGREGDGTYVLVTAIVLANLMVGFLFGVG